MSVEIFMLILIGFMLFIILILFAIKAVMIVQYLSRTT